jgi:hypothetical protein
VAEPSATRQLETAANQQAANVQIVRHPGASSLSLPVCAKYCVDCRNCDDLAGGKTVRGLNAGIPFGEQCESVQWKQHLDVALAEAPPMDVLDGKLNATERGTLMRLK